MTLKAMELHLAQWASWIPYALFTLNLLFCSFWNATVFLKKSFSFLGTLFSVGLHEAVVLSEIQLSRGFVGSQLQPLHLTRATGTSQQLERCDKQGQGRCLYAGRETHRTSCSLRLPGKKRWSFPWHSPVRCLFKRAIKWPHDFLTGTNTCENICFRNHSHGHTASRTDTPFAWVRLKQDTAPVWQDVLLGDLAEVSGPQIQSLFPII